MTEHLIIGGGVYGCALAWELTRRGAGCRLLESKTVASGASGGPGRRGVRANGRDPREIPLIRRAREIWPSLHEALGVAPLFERSGHLLLIERPEDLLEAEARVSLQNRMGVPSRLLGKEETRELEPAVSDAVCGAIHCPDDGVADHTATTRAYGEAAKAAGAVIEEGVAAKRLIVEGARVIAVETAEGASHPVTGHLFVLANPAVRALLAPRLDLPLWNLAFQALLSAPIEQVPFRHLIGHAHRTLSLKSEAGSRVMISGGRLGRWDEARQSGTTIDSEIAANVADAVAVYPSLAGLEIEVADAGHLESLSPDGVPVIDRLPGVENATFATGWCGHGWAIAPAVAPLLVDWALDGERPEALAPFVHRRFET